MYSRKDSNFGWLIVAASFLSHFFQYGIVWTVGVFYVIFLEHIGGSSGAVALISSLNTAMFYSTGNVIDYSFIQNLNFYKITNVVNEISLSISKFCHVFFF